MSQKEVIINHELFSECSKLTKIKIPKYVKKISNNSFKKCTSLVEVTFEEPSSLLFIGAFAFKDCKLLTQITIPSNVLLIGKHAFENCTSLSQITIPSNARIVNGLSNIALNTKIVQSKPLENEYEKVLHKFVSIIDPTEFTNVVSDDDEILNRIVEAFNKFPCLLDEDAHAIMEKFSELGIENDVEKYFSAFNYKELTLFMKVLCEANLILNLNYTDLEKTDTLYEDMYQRYYDGINSIKIVRKSGLLPRTGTFRDNNVENETNFILVRTLVGG